MSIDLDGYINTSGCHVDTLGSHIKAVDVTMVHLDIRLNIWTPHLIHLDLMLKSGIFFYLNGLLTPFSLPSPPPPLLPYLSVCSFPPPLHRFPAEGKTPSLQQTPQQTAPEPLHIWRDTWSEFSRDPPEKTGRKGLIEEAGSK